MPTYSGVVDETGGVAVQGSGGWVPQLVNVGRFRVTFNSAASQPLPTVSIASNDLSGQGAGVKGFINVTDMGQDNQGRWYFGVAMNSRNGVPYSGSFSFIAQET